MDKLGLTKMGLFTRGIFILAAGFYLKSFKTSVLAEMIITGVGAVIALVGLFGLKERHATDRI